ncbi:MAG: hypothetical protein FWC96_04805 [Oscillospiraceae bacterium]|nr:hypothetical protein [Oscillospiraceae bacterium]
MHSLARWREKVTCFFESKRNFYIVLFAAMLLKNFPFGFRYFRFADDYIQFRGYFFGYESLWRDVFVHHELYGYRPLAGLTDVFIISRFWDNLAIVLLAIVILHFVTIYLLGKLFERSNIIWGRAAAVFFALYPTLTESAYWISASSRIVTSAFFAVAAAFAIVKFIYKEGRHWIWFTAAMLSGLLAQGFYEQGIVFAFVLTLGVLIIYRKAVKHKILFAWPFANLAVIATHYYIFRNTGLLGRRANVVQQSLFQQIPEIAGRIGRTFVMEQMPTIGNTLRLGIRQLFTEHLVLTIFVAIFALLLSLFIVFEKSGNAEYHGSIGADKRTARSLLAAFILTVCTLMIYFFLANPWIWVRNFFFAVIGLAIFVEIGLRCIRQNKNKLIATGLKIGKTAVVFFACFVFFCGFILEVNSLRLVEKYDNIIVSNLVKEVGRLELAEEVEIVWFFGPRWTYARKINPRITSQLRINWALNGHFTVVSDGNRNQRFIPVMAGGTSNVDFEHDILLGLDSSLNVRKLRFDGRYLIFTDTGTIFGSIDIEENGRFTPK